MDEKSFAWHMTVNGNGRCGIEFGDSLESVARKIKGSGAGVEGVFVYWPGHPEAGELRTGVYVTE